MSPVFIAYFNVNPREFILIKTLPFDLNTIMSTFSVGTIFADLSSQYSHINSPGMNFSVKATNISRFEVNRSTSRVVTATVRQNIFFFHITVLSGASGYANAEVKGRHKFYPLPTHQTILMSVILYMIKKGKTLSLKSHALNH